MYAHVLTSVIHYAVLTTDPTSAVDLLDGIGNLLLVFPILLSVIGGKAIIGVAVQALRGAKSVAR